MRRGGYGRGSSGRGAFFVVPGVGGLMHNYDSSYVCVSCGASGNKSRGTVCPGFMGPSAAPTPGLHVVNWGCETCGDIRTAPPGFDPRNTRPVGWKCGKCEKNGGHEFFCEFVSSDDVCSKCLLRVTEIINWNPLGEVWKPCIGTWRGELRRVDLKTWRHGYCTTCAVELTPALDGERATACSKHQRRT